MEGFISNLLAATIAAVIAHFIIKAIEEREKPRRKRQPKHLRQD